MAQNTHQRQASSRVAAWMAKNEVTNAWLAEKADADLGTIGDFLNGHRWPKKTTQGRIEKALGWPAGSIHQLGQGDAVDVPMDRSVGGPAQDAIRTQEGGYVEAPGARVEAGITNEDLLREILRSRAEYDQLRAEQRELRTEVTSIRAEVRDLSGRMERVERDT